MFQDLRYELNGGDTDKVRNLGITSTMKTLVSLDEGEIHGAEVSGWSSTGGQPETVQNKNFSAHIPLKRLAGIFEDYKKIMLASKHELILIRSRTDVDCLIVDANKDAKIVMTKVEWHVPHVQVNDEIKLKLLNAVKKNQTIIVPFRTQELYELPTVRTNSKEIWAVKTSTNVARPRYVIFGFQTARRNIKTADASKFDHCNLRNIKLFINSECYPYDDLNLNFNSNLYAKAYVMYSNFMRSYYERDNTHPTLGYSEFKNNPLFVIDCSKQNESVKLGSCNVRLEFEANADFPANTTAYSLSYMTH